MSAWVRAPALTREPTQITLPPGRSRRVAQLLQRRLAEKPPHIEGLSSQTSNKMAPDRRNGASFIGATCTSSVRRLSSRFSRCWMMVESIHVPRSRVEGHDRKRSTG